MPKRKQLQSIDDLSKACTIAAYLYAEQRGTCEEISAATRYSVQTIYAIVYTLVRHHILSGVRGRGGGYSCSHNFCAWDIFVRCFHSENLKDPIVLALKRELKDLTLKDIAQCKRYFK